jgi:hypothetical protein
VSDTHETVPDFNGVVPSSRSAERRGAKCRGERRT